MTRYADLHIHTHYSDSTFSPGEVVDCAVRCGLSAIAICDHDSVDGIRPCREAASNLGLEIVPGIELTVEKADAEIHILGYFIDTEKDWFLRKLKSIQDYRIERIHRMIEKLLAEDIKVDPKEVMKLSGKGSVGRLHLARAIVNTGRLKSFREIFDKYIGFMKPCYVSNIKWSPKDAIETILKAGGVPVLAHPGIMKKDEYISELTSYGLRGIEVYHTDHDAGAVRHYEELAEQKGLLMTGGSDCHGMGKGRVMIGGVKIDYSLVEKLKAESLRIKDGNG